MLKETTTKLKMENGRNEMEEEILRQRRKLEEKTWELARDKEIARLEKRYATLVASTNV